MLPDFKPQPWMEDAECAGYNPEHWFPEVGGPVNTAAKAICRRCPVATKCLDYALDIEGDASQWGRHGIYGGMTPEQRAQLARPGRTA